MDDDLLSEVIGAVENYNAAIAAQRTAEHETTKALSTYDLYYESIRVVRATDALKQRIDSYIDARIDLKLKER